jgi:hypothetical protein
LPLLRFQQEIDDLWYVLNTVDGDVAESVMDEIDFAGDRAAAIVGAAFVEDHLTHYIRSRMVSDGALQNKLFSPGAVFGDFGAKNQSWVPDGFIFKAMQTGVGCDKGNSEPVCAWARDTFLRYPCHSR